MANAIERKDFLTAKEAFKKVLIKRQSGTDLLTILARVAYVAEQGTTDLIHNLSPNSDCIWIRNELTNLGYSSSLNPHPTEEGLLQIKLSWEGVE